MAGQLGKTIFHLQRHLLALSGTVAVNRLGQALLLSVQPEGLLYSEAPLSAFGSESDAL